MELELFFEQYPEVAIAFSGGVDSAYLLYEAKRHAVSVKAYYVKSQFQPEFELQDAKHLATELGVELEILEIDALADACVRKNDGQRCYYCKRRIMETLLSAASKDGYHIILDGTNASDDAGDRPGMKALEELHILSPLKMCGLTKEMIRQRSKTAGLFTWDKPAYACLATRTQMGEELTDEKLSRTEWAERYLADLGFRNFRVRSIKDTAKLQVTETDMDLLLRNRRAITEYLKEWYDHVLLDMEVRD